MHWESAALGRSLSRMFLVCCIGKRSRTQNEAGGTPEIEVVKPDTLCARGQIKQRRWRNEEALLIVEIQKGLSSSWYDTALWWVRTSTLQQELFRQC